MSPREALYQRLPAPASPDLLYDYDVVLVGDRFLTVYQCWHGPDGVESVKCLPGAIPLYLLGSGFGTGLQEVALAPDGPQVLLLGAFTPELRPILARNDEAGSDDDEVRALFPGHGRFRSAELVTDEVGAGDVLVLEDGHPHEVSSDGSLITLDVKTWNRSSGQEIFMPVTGRPRVEGDRLSPSQPLLLQDYLACRDMDELPLVRLV